MHANHFRAITAMEAIHISDEVMSDRDYLTRHMSSIS